MGRTSRRSAAAPAPAPLVSPGAALRRRPRPAAPDRRRFDGGRGRRDLVRVHAQDDDRPAPRRRLRGRRRGRHLRPRRARADRFPQLELAGDWTLDSFSSSSTGSTSSPPARRPGRLPRLPPLGLRIGGARSGAAPGGAVARPPHSGASTARCRFVSSTRATSLEPWLALYPDLRFKLDPTPDWTDEFIAALAARRIASTSSTSRGSTTAPSSTTRPTPSSTRRVAEAFSRRVDRGSGADARDGARARAASRPRSPGTRRSTHGRTSRRCLSRRSCLNSKPSRFGSLARLFDFYDRCAERGIALYGGGQFELGVGRGQIQLLASLFHPPTGRTTSRLAATTRPSRSAGLETSPLEPHAERIGFRRAV